MFKKALFAKFEWGGLPKPLTNIFVEHLIFNSSDNNFAVTMRDNVEFWSYFNVINARETLYGLPQQIQTLSALGGAVPTSDFVLFNNFSSQDMVSNYAYIKSHTAIIAKINQALIEHIDASQLIATIYANSAAEAQSLKKLYSRFSGVKIVESSSTLLNGEKKYDIVQFDITPRTNELEHLKHDIENDLFLRLGIDTGIDKSHITDSNLHDSEQVIDLINSYELKLRTDFCERLTAWRAAHGNNTPCTVKIHTIDRTNTIEKTQGGVQNATDTTDTE